MVLSSIFAFPLALVVLVIGLAIGGVGSAPSIVADPAPALTTAAPPDNPAISQLPTPTTVDTQASEQARKDAEARSQAEAAQRKLEADKAATAEKAATEARKRATAEKARAAAAAKKRATAEKARAAAAAKKRATAERRMAAAAAKKRSATKARERREAAALAAQERADERDTFSNCTDMHQVYPHGVGLPGAHDHSSGTPVTTFKVSRRIYDLNLRGDRDDDGVACEKR